MNEVTRSELSVRATDAAAHTTGRAPGLHDAAARWRAPDRASFTSPVDNVILLRRASSDGARNVPPIAAGADARPAPAFWEGRQLPRLLALLLLSAAVHVGLYLPFRHAPSPMASIGEVSVSVEVVLGADQHAGLTPDQGTSQASAPTPAQAPEVKVAETPLQPAPAETARVEAPAEPPATPPEATPIPPRQATAAAEMTTQAEEAASQAAPSDVRPEAAAPVVAAVPAEASPSIRTVVPVEAVADARPTPAPVQAMPHAETAAAAELLVSASPPPAEKTAAAAVDKPAEADTADKPDVAVAEAVTETEVATVTLPAAPKPPLPPEKRQARPAAPERTRSTVRERRPQRPQRVAAQGERNRSETTSPASAAAGGVGRGRSDASSNYRGMVAAHLARHKRFPADARSRGSQGSATVTFALDGGGRVTNVRLARGSGVASLDQEATAMVRRASPFPAPPGGRGMSFTVPVSFRIN